MSFEEYKNLSNMLVLYMRNEEIRAETEPSGMFIDIINKYIFISICIFSFM